MQNGLLPRSGCLATYNIGKLNVYLMWHIVCQQTAMIVKKKKKHFNTIWLEKWVTYFNAISSFCIYVVLHTISLHICIGIFIAAERSQLSALNGSFYHIQITFKRRLTRSVILVYMIVMVHKDIWRWVLLSITTFPTNCIMVDGALSTVFFRESKGLKRMSSCCI